MAKFSKKRFIIPQSPGVRVLSREEMIALEEQRNREKKNASD